MMKHFYFLTIFLCVCALSVHAQDTKSKGSFPSKPDFSVSPLKFNDEVGIDDLLKTPKYNLESEKELFKDVNLNYQPVENTSFIYKPYAKFIVPTVLIAYGVTTRFYKPLRNLDRSTDHEIGEHYPRTVWVDDYLQFAPAVAVYGLDLVGVSAKHNFRDRTLIMATSYLVMGATVETMKRTISVARPGDRGTSSFPSGHTAAAFVGAHILMKEYIDVSPFIGVAGYTAATGVGVMRMINRKHWISDVVAGAGIGVLSAEVGYLMLPIWHNIFGMKDRRENLVFTPTVVPDYQGKIGYGVGMAYSF